MYISRPLFILQHLFQDFAKLPWAPLMDTGHHQRFTEKFPALVEVVQACTADVALVADVEYQTAALEGRGVKVRLILNPHWSALFHIGYDLDTIPRSIGVQGGDGEFLILPMDDGILSGLVYEYPSDVGDLASF
jgi:hypothetical protein